MPISLRLKWKEQIIREIQNTKIYSRKINILVIYTLMNWKIFKSSTKKTSDSDDFTSEF